MNSFNRIKQSAVPAALLLALVQSCGSNSSSVSSVPGSLIPEGPTVSAATSCFAGQVTFEASAFDQSTVEVDGATFVLVDLPAAPDFYAALQEDANVALDPKYCGAESPISLIYLDDPTVVTFDDYVLVRALGTLPPSLRTPANIATAANDLFQSRNPDFQGADFDPVPDEINTNYVSRGSTPAPDLLDAALVLAASLLPDQLRTLENLVSTVNAIFPSANLLPSEVNAIPPALPGGIPVAPSVGPLSAGTIQISIQQANFAAPNFTVGAAEFTRLPTTIFTGFTSYGALAGSSLIEINFSQLNIPGATANTCIVVHRAGEDPTLQFNQLAVSAACQSFDSGFELQSDSSAFLSQAAVDFTLQVLHAADQEAGVAALSDAPRFSSVLNALAAEFSNTVKLTSGDLWIPGPFYNVTGGQADVDINSALGWQASVLGNHEFDFGTLTLAGLIPRATFPFLSANLNFSTDANLDDFITAPGQEASAIPGDLTSRVVITVNGERIGVVGVTTPLLSQISSPGNVTISPSSPTNIAGLAPIVQAEVDALTATGIDKVILLAHLQQIQNEIQLAGLIEDVDILMAGGSDTLLANPGNRIRTEFGKEPSGTYPLLLSSASGEPIALINTDREYRYVGRLIAGFDGDGILARIDNRSRPYPTDDQGVTETGNVDPNPIVVAEVEEVADVLLALDGTFFGETTVFLNGERQDVRAQETNLGNLTADANLAAARAVDPTVTVSIKNGGGIRASIGAVLPGAEGLRVPPLANPLTGKEEGQISTLDIQNALRFNNGLTLLTLSPLELKNILEHGVARVGNGAWIQVGGLRFSYNPAGTAIAFGPDGSVTTPGTRVQNVALINASGAVTQVLVRNGVVEPGAPANIRVVTLNFLADVASPQNPGIGGDGYPFPAFGENRVPLFTGTATTFDVEGREQQALADFLEGLSAPFSEADVAASQDTRIQNLAVRNDTVLP